MVFLCHEEGLSFWQQRVEAEGPLPAAESYAGAFPLDGMRIVVEPGDDESRACWSWGDDRCIRYEAQGGQILHVERFGKAQVPQPQQ